MEKPIIHPPFVRNFFFWSGIIATIAYRIIVILNHISQPLALLSWYIGTIGFVLYFYHRYEISEKRSKLIRDYDLERKVNTITSLSNDEREAMQYIFSTLTSTKEKWNYICIFVASGIALVLGVYLDFIAAIV